MVVKLDKISQRAAKKMDEIVKKHDVSASFSDGLLVCDVIEEFVELIPSHINDMPAFSSNGVTRNEMEWKHLAFSMASEIIKLRKAN